MSLQVVARVKATVHLWSHLNLFRGHRIWRVYSHFGFKTYRVFCECGTEFTKLPEGNFWKLSVNELVTEMKDRRKTFLKKVL